MDIQQIVEILHGILYPSTKEKDVFVPRKGKTPMIKIIGGEVYPLAAINENEDNSVIVLKKGEPRRYKPAQVEQVLLS